MEICTCHLASLDFNDALPGITLCNLWQEGFTPQYFQDDHSFKVNSLLSDLDSVSCSTAINMCLMPTRGIYGSVQSTCSVSGAPPSFAYEIFSRSRSFGGNVYEMLEFELAIWLVKRKHTPVAATIFMP